MNAEAAIASLAERARADRAAAERRWAAAGGPGPLAHAAEQFRRAGRVTLNFHPDRVARGGRTVAAGLQADGRYRSQWATGISAGSRSAVAGGDRQRFERELFAGAYDHVDASLTPHPVYGSLDLLLDEHGGSPRFGSGFAVLRPHVRERTTLCLGDSHAGPPDIGTFDAPWSILAGLAEQAAQRELLGRGLGLDTLRQCLDGTHGPREASRDLDGYVEAQVHGGVSLADDVDAIVLDPSFRTTPVEHDLAAAAERYGFELAWHHGSELHVDDVPDDFRGPTMPTVARRAARPDGMVDAHAIGLVAARAAFEEPTRSGDPRESDLQQLKHLWHTLLAHGNRAADRTANRTPLPPPSKE